MSELIYVVRPICVFNSAGYNIVDPSWPTDRRIYGWYPGILGPGWYGDNTFSLQCPALSHLDTVLRDPLDDLWDTPEEAMEAWENATPCHLSEYVGRKYYLRKRNCQAIDAHHCYRTILQDETPF